MSPIDMQALPRARFGPDRLRGETPVVLQPADDPGRQPWTGYGMSAGRRT